VSVLQKIMRFIMIRKAAYAGSFYEASPDILKQQFDKWFNKAVIPETISKVSGVICPHAGYIYSGACAAYSYKLLAKDNFRTVIILHPSHRGSHFGFSVSPFDEYQTPLGVLKLDKQLSEIFIAEGAQIIDSMYHQNEHSMEVQLPFLKYSHPDIKVLPVMIGNQNDEVSLKLAKILSGVLLGNTYDTAVIVSTDLSHYHPAKAAEFMDNKLIEYVINGDAQGFYQNIAYNKIEACGFAGVLALLHLMDILTDKKIVQLNYTHSGYASNDYDQVVGYLSAAMVSK
jgi:AmmeMemoRadiSam system protein B